METDVVRDGRGVSVRLVLVVALLATAVAWIGLRLWFDAGHALPGASWGGAVLIVFMAVGVYFAGLPIRRFLRGEATRPLSPLRAMRTLVLAQAAALTGALVAGWYAAQALVLLPDADVDSVRAAMLRSLAVCVSGVLMIVAGLLVQSMCRIDDQHDRDREEHDRDRDRDDRDHDLNRGRDGDRHHGRDRDRDRGRDRGRDRDQR
jgi:signal transduction histidine kinase